MTQNSNQPKQTDDLDISKIILDLKNRWHYFLVASVVFTIVAWLYVKFTLPVYQASSTILIEEDKSSPKNIEDFISTDLFSSNMSLPTEIGIIKSRTVIQNTIDELKLRVQYSSNEVFPSKPLYQIQPFNIEVIQIDREMQDLPFQVNILDKDHAKVLFEYDYDVIPDFTINKTLKFGEIIESKYFKLKITRNDSVALPDAQTVYEFKVRSPNKLIREILENLTVEALDKDANIVQLVYLDVVPRRALDMLNTIAKVYIDLDIQDKASVAALTLKFVDEQLSNTGTALSSTEQEMQNFKERNKTVDLSEESKAILQKLNDLDVERVKNNIETSALENLYTYVYSNNDITNLAPTSMGIPDPLLVELITSYQSLQSKRKAASYGVNKDAPSVRVLDQQIKEVKDALLENIKSIQKRSTVTRKSILEQIAQYENSIKSVPDKERQLLGIQRNFVVNQNIYTYLLQKKAETSIAQATVVSDNKILDIASLADEPVSPNKKLIAILIALLIATIPTIIVVLNVVFRNTITNRDDITKLTSVPVLGIVGHSSSKAGLAVHDKPKSAIAEAFRTVRTNLQFYGLNNGKKVLMITSSVGGEGKSFVTLNLATALALQQRKVIVVGLDLRKPKLFEELEIKNDIGASNYLAGTVDLEKAIFKTKVPNLDVIPAGPIPPNPAELLSTPALGKMIEELKKIYDFIVIDTPPIGIVSDAYHIIPLSDIKIYIVRQGYSKAEYLRSLEELRRDNKLANFSIILNDSNFSNSYGYGNGHHYGYINDSSGYYEDESSGGIKKLLKRK
jgi:capsular exopolysaccharide synthesis family protein